MRLRTANARLGVVAVMAALTVCTTGTGFAGNQQLVFQAGSKAYLDGDWHGALEHWNRLLEEGYSSGELYYNIGNAFFKVGELGEAILNWEKAAKLLGTDDDIQANLRMARARLVDKLDEPVKLPVWNWLDRLRAVFSTTLLAWLAPVFCALLFLALGLRRWVLRSGTVARLMPVVAVAAGVLLTADAALLILKARDELSVREGVFTIPAAEVLSAPAEGSGKLLFTIHEGSKVRVLRELQDWYEISAGKEKQGWVKKEALGII